VPARPPGETVRLVEALGLARGDHQQRAFPRRADPPERLEHRLLFPLERRGGDDHGPIGRHAEVAEDPVRAAAAGRLVGHVERVELQRPGHGHTRAVGAELDDAPRRFLVLHAEAVDVGEHPPDKDAREPVPRIGAGGDAAVDEDGPDPGLPAGTQHVRPDLCFHDDEEARPHQADRAVHDRAQIEGEVEHVVDVLEVGARHLLPGDGGRRQEQPQMWIARPQIGKQRARGEHLAYRDGVNPDRLLAVEIERAGEVAEPLRQVDHVLAVAHGLVHEVGRYDEPEQHDQDAVCRVHVDSVL
jgi:hypothetical protein